MPNEPIDTQFILYQLRRQGITNRNDVIKTLRASGLTSFEANEVLNAGGLGNLTRAERSGFPKTYGGQIAKGFKRNLKEIAASFPTLAGATIKGIGELGRTTGGGLPSQQIKREEAQVEAMRKFREEHPGFVKNPLASLFNTMFGQYNIDTNRIGGTFTGKGRRLSLDDFLYGLAENPIYAGVDALTMGGGQVVKGVGKAIGKTRVGKRIGGLRDFNRLLNTAALEEEKTLIKQEPTLRRFERTFRSLSKKGKEAVSRALQQTGEVDLGKKSWNKALELARKSSLETSQEMIDLGLLTKEQNANNIIANYIGNNIGWGNKGTIKDSQTIKELLEKFGVTDKEIRKSLPSNKPFHTPETRAAIDRDERIVADALGVSPKVVRMNKNKRWLLEKDFGVGDLEAKATQGETYLGNVYVDYNNIDKSVRDALDRLRVNDYKTTKYTPEQYQQMQYNYGLNKVLNKYIKDPKTPLSELEDYVIKNSEAIDWGYGGLTKEQAIEKNLTSLYKTINDIEDARSGMKGLQSVDHDTILKWIENPKTMPEEIKSLYAQGRKLQEEGRLGFVSQAVNPATNNLGTKIDIAPSYHEQRRYVGTRTPEQMAEFLPQALELQARHAATHKGFQNFIRRLKNYESGKPLLGDADAKYYSLPKMYEHVQEGGRKGSSASTIMRSMPEATAEEIASGNALRLGKVERDALNRYLSHGGRSNEYLNMFKRAVLGGTKWFTENRIQNLINNTIEGVTPKHYARALDSIKKGNYPEQLNVLTRAYGYAENLPSPFIGAMAEGLERMGLGIKGAFTHAGDKNLAESARSLAEVPLGAADIVSNPMFDLEAQFDRIERLANYEKHLEDVASKTGKNVDEIRDLAQKNTDVFEALYGAVNKSLGDYTSKNYYMPRATQDILEAASPFWKFPYNTIRTTTHQIMDKPIGTQAINVIPSKVGRDIWYNDVQQIDPEMQGGYPTGRLHPTSGRPTMITTEGHPLTAVINQLTGDITAGGPEDFARGVSPVMKMIYPLTLKNSFGKPAQTDTWGISRDPASGAEVLFHKDKKTGLPIYDEQTLSPLEYANWLTTQGLKQFYSPTVHGMNETRKVTRGLFEPLYRSITTNTPLQEALKTATLYPTYDDELFPWVEGDVTKNPTVGAASILSPLVGVREVAPYTVPEKTKRNAFKSMAKKMQKRKTPFLEGYVEYNVER